MLIAQETNIQPKRSLLDSLSFMVLQVLLFLAPVFFVPVASVPFQASKSAFIIYAVVATFLLWLIARLKDGFFAVPKSLFFASAGLLAVTYSLAAVLSPNQAVSFFGQSFELGTLAFFVPSLALFALVPLVVRSKERIFYSYATLLASFFVIGIIHIIRFVFGPDAFTLGMLASSTANLIGKWNDLGIFFGLTAVVSLITLEKATLNKLFRLLVNIAFFLSMAMVAVVNFSILWVTLAVISLIFFVHEMSLGKRDRVASGKGLPVYAVVSLVISLVFVFAGNQIGGLIASTLGVSQVEVRPSLSATWEVTKTSLAHDAFFGTGPNRFSSQWLLNKPDGINQTIFWNVDFNYGFGFIPSFALTTGVLGALSVMLLVGLFLFSAVKSLLRQGNSPFSRYLVLSSFIGAGYLWVFSFVYVPSPVIWMLTMFMSGLFLSAVREDGSVQDTACATAEKPAANFISVLLIIFALIGTIAFAYALTVRLAAGTYFQKALIESGATGGIDKAEASLARALSLAPSDSYYKALSELQLSRVSEVFADQKMSKTDAQKAFQDRLSLAIQAANQAVALDPSNYSNFVSLGAIFESVIPLKIEGAYEGAKQAYEQALKLNPSNPEIYLGLARLDVAKGDNTAARANIGKALEKKGDYASAIYLLAQIQIGERNVPEAIRSVEAVAQLSPTDAGIFFQLGLLYYDQRQFQNAVLAFGRAVTINPQYANAKYLLGLAFYEVKDTASALDQFKQLEVTNPDNAEIKAIITNLESGKAPLAPVAAKGKLPTLPVKETAVREGI